MKALTKTGVVLVCITVVLAAVGAWAQEAEPPPATPEEVLRQFSETDLNWDPKLEGLLPLLTEESVEALGKFERGVLFSFVAMVLWPQLQPLETEIAGERCTVTAVRAPRAVQVKLVKENDQWKIDLLGTLGGFEESLGQRGDPETPEDVVKLFGVLTPLIFMMMFDEAEGLPESIRLLQAALKVLLSADSGQLLENKQDQRLVLLAGWEIGFSPPFELWPQEVRIEEETATISALSYRTVQRIKLVKEHGGWKIDLAATLDELRLPVLLKREAERRNDCLSNVKNLNTALLIYAAEHDQHLPPADRWMDELARYGAVMADLLRCPGAPDLEYGYAFNANLSGVNLDDIDNPAEIVLIFDSNLGTRNAAGGPEAVADPPRHNDGNNYGFADGHSEWSAEIPNFGAAREATAPAGGRGQAPVVLELSSASFAQEVLEADGLVLLDAWGSLCEPCIELKPIFHEVATEYADRVKFCSLNLGLAEDIAEKYNLRWVPTLIIFADGEELDRRVGVMDKAELKAWLDKYLRP